jgi:hypothetical protein
VESLENQDQVFHPSHRPWKSLRDSHIPTGVSSDTASGFLLYVFIFRTPLQASYKYDRETPWPVLATRPTMIHEEGRTARRPRVLTDERG